MSRRRSPRRRIRPVTARERASRFLPLRSWRLQLAGAAIAVIVAILSAQSFASAREAASTYLIQPGDTLSAIAATSGVAIDRLVSLNAIQDPNLIIAGQTLSLVGSAAAPQTDDPRYTVKTGDTLWDIARATGVGVDALAQANNLDHADQLSVGQVLRVPAAATQHAAAIPAVQKPKPTPTPSAQAKPAAAKANPTP
ncbi:MAG TPA: LysM peptidoglycan-binding domain-containing protein, partial [Chloroflexota bacterium]